MEYVLESHDPALLEKARRIALDFATPFRTDSMAGIVFLGALARGYFDREADIDIAFIARSASDLPALEKFSRIDGIEVHCHVSDYETELRSTWDMAKRWTYSECEIFHDPDNRIRSLLDEKVPLKAEEKKRLLMSGLTLSEWYCNRLPELWMERGDPGSAHFMFNQGLNYLFDLLFALNGSLVPDHKWRFHCARKLERLPPGYSDAMRKIMTLREISEEELGERRRSFMEIWNPMVPVVEREVGLPYSEILNRV